MCLHKKKLAFSFSVRRNIDIFKAFFDLYKDGCSRWVDLKGVGETKLVNCLYKVSHRPQANVGEEEYA